MATANKTKPTDVKVSEFLKGVSKRRQEEATLLIEMMRKISKEEAVMWGPSIIGFGSEHYKYESGREGDMPKLSFSPRKTALTIYFSSNFKDQYTEELKKLGKHKSSVACLYINKLEDIDIDVLEAMLKKSWKKMQEKSPQSVQDYVESVPEQAKKKLEELRTLVKEVLPEAKEVLSYGILGYKEDPKKRAKVFVSAFKDHVGLYPAPLDGEIQKQVQPYLHGKRSLRFDLKETLPEDLIKKVILVMSKAKR